MSRELYEAFLTKLSLTTPREFRDKRFEPQDRFVTDTNRFISAQCSRRAGKSNGLAIRFFHTLDSHPGCFCPYIALTRESAKNIMWPVLQEQDEVFKIGFKFTESDLTMTHPTNGSRLQLFGADMKNFIRRLKGIKTPGAAIDESQDFGDHLSSLVDDVLTPALSDYEDSWLALVGTPGPIPRGYFYEITNQRKFGYSLHKWTAFDNPYLPNFDGFLNKLKLDRGWDDKNPTLLREYMNQWVLDIESLLVKYDENKNHFETLPPAIWHHILGIDIGHKDADALAVLAWSETSPNIYLVDEITTAGQDITALASQIDKITKYYDITKMVIDTGGLGKKIAEELIRRHQIPVEAADKARKFENISFLNDYLRQGKFKAGKNSIFAQDSYKVQIDWDKTTPDRLVVKEGFHSDIIDAVLYAFKESPAFAYRTPKLLPKYGTKEWADNQVVDMEKAAVEHFSKQESDEEWVF